MGEAADAALRRIEEARTAFEQDVVTLESRLPPAAQMARAAGGSAAAAAVLGAAGKVLSDKRDKKKEDEALAKEASVQARAIAAALAAQAQMTAGQGTPASAPTTSSPVDAADRASALVQPGTKPKKQASAPSPSSSGDDGAPWGLIVLLVAVAAAIAAYLSQSGDEDIWIDEADQS